MRGRPSFTEVFFTRFPVGGSILFHGFARALFGILIVLIAAARAVDFFAPLGTIAPYRHFRYTALAYRDGSTPSAWPGIQEFGVMSREDGSFGITDSCRSHAMNNKNMTVSGNQMTLTLAEAGSTRFTSWYIVTMQEPGTQPKDAVRIRVQSNFELPLAIACKVGRA